MSQKFKIPVYLILKKDIYDESNEYTMVAYSFDRDEAMDKLGGEVMKYARQHQVDASIPEWCTNKSVWEVGSQIFELEEREITV